MQTQHVMAPQPLAVEYAVELPSWLTSLAGHPVSLGISLVFEKTGRFTIDTADKGVFEVDVGGALTDAFVSGSDSSFTAGRFIYAVVARGILRSLPKLTLRSRCVVGTDWQEPTERDGQYSWRYRVVCEHGDTQAVEAG